MVDVYDFVAAGRDIYMVMEFLVGRDLHQELYAAASQPIAIPRVVGILEQICGALQMAHEYDDPFSLALTHCFGSVAQQVMGDTERAAGNAALSVKIATEHGLLLPRIWSTGVLGWCSVAGGDAGRGRRQGGVAGDA